MFGTKVPGRVYVLTDTGESVAFHSPLQTRALKDLTITSDLPDCPMPLRRRIRTFFLLFDEPTGRPKQTCR